MEMTAPAVAHWLVLVEVISSFASLDGGSMTGGGRGRRGRWKPTDAALPLVLHSSLRTPHSVHVPPPLCHLRAAGCRHPAPATAPVHRPAYVAALVVDRRRSQSVSGARQSPYGCVVLVLVVVVVCVVVSAAESADAVAQPGGCGAALHRAAAAAAAAAAGERTGRGRGRRYATLVIRLGQPETSHTIGCADLHPWAGRSVGSC